MSDEPKMPNILLGETPQGTLLITDLATGEQSEHKIIVADSGNFCVINELPDDLRTIPKSERQGVFRVPIVLKANGGTERGGLEIKGTLLMHGDTFSVYNSKRTYTPSHIVLSVDESDMDDVSLCIVAGKVLNHWHHIVGIGQPVERLEGGSE